MGVGTFHKRVSIVLVLIGISFNLGSITRPISSTCSQLVRLCGQEVVGVVCGSMLHLSVNVLSITGSFQEPKHDENSAGRQENIPGDDEPKKFLSFLLHPVEFGVSS